MHPIKAAFVAAACSLPYAINRFNLLIRDEIHDFDVVEETLRTGSPLIVFNLAELIFIILRARSKESTKQPHILFSLAQFKKVVKLKSYLQSQNPPKFNRKEAQQVKGSFVESLTTLTNLFSDSSDYIKNAAMKTQSPSLLMDAARRLFDKLQYDEGMDFVRRAIDLSKGRQVGTRSIFQSLYLLNVRLAAFLARTLVPHDVTNYMFSSAYYALTNPQKAWYFSQLGKLVADEFNSPFRKEMYVFDALLASAQGRSDEEQAWKEAIGLVRQDPMERLGESRTIVRRIANSPFFANTFLFKERESLEALVRERQNCEELAELLPDAAVPKPLYLTQVPENGLHYLVLRFLPGETLYAMLQRGDKSAMLQVIKTLAQIHARFKPDLPVANIREKLEERLIEFGPIRTQIRANYTPIIASLDKIPLVWNKDAHPENWQISERIGVLDCEVTV